MENTAYMYKNLMYFCKLQKKYNIIYGMFFFVNLSTTKKAK